MTCLGLCWYRSLMYCATAHTELVVRSAKKMISQHFKMCTKSTTHKHSLMYSVHQHTYAVLCAMRTKLEAVVPSNNGQCDDVSNVNAVFGF